MGDDDNGELTGIMGATSRAYPHHQSASTCADSSSAVSKYIGVSKIHNRQQFRARIKINGKAVHLGSFDSEVKAARAYNRRASFLGRPLNVIGTCKSRLATEKCVPAN